MPLHFTLFPNSTCGQRVRAVLAEKGITDYTTFVPDFMNGAHKQKPHTDKHPFGRVPIVEDDGFTLYESRAICQYVAVKYDNQGTKLIPDSKDLKATALFWQFASVELEYFSNAAETLVGQKFFNPKKGLPTVAEIVEGAEKSLKTTLPIFDQILSKQQYMGGDEFSLVDIYYLPFMNMLSLTGDGALITDHPNLNAWWQKVSTRESWQKVLASPL